MKDTISLLLEILYRTPRSKKLFQWFREGNFNLRDDESQNWRSFFDLGFDSCPKDGKIDDYFVVGV